MSNGFADAFIEEGREHLTEIENNLIALEDNSDDEEAMNQVFRSAHTLKGNAGAMGFEHFSELAHEMEEILDEVRGDSLELTSEIVDDLFAAADALREMLTQIDEEGDPQYIPEDEIEALHAILDDGEDSQCAALTKEDERCSLNADEDSDYCWQHLEIVEEDGEEAIKRYDDETEGDSDSTDAEEETVDQNNNNSESVSEDLKDIESLIELVVPPEDTAPNAYHVVVEIDGDNQTVLEALADAFDVLATRPSREELRGEYNGSFATVIAGNIASENDVVSWFEPMSDVASLEATEITGRVDWAEETSDTRTSEPTSEIDDDIEIENIDDLDAIVGTSDFDEVEDVGEDAVDDVELGMDEVGDAGTFDNAHIDSEDETEDVEEDEETSDSSDIPDNKGARIFDELSGEVEQADGFDEIEAEMEEMGFGEEFDEMDTDEEIEFEELVAADPDEIDFEETEDDSSSGGLFDNAASEESAGLFGGDDSDDDADESIDVSTSFDLGDDVEVDSSDDEDEELMETGLDDDPFASITSEEEEDVDQSEIDVGSSSVDENEDETDTGANEIEGLEVDTGSDDIFGSEFDDTESVDFDDLLREANDSRSEPSVDSESIDSIRVDVNQLDEMYSLVQELVTSRIRLRRAIADDSTNDELSQAFDELDTLDMITTRMQDTVMDIRLVRLDRITDRLPRVVRDTARENDKEVNFEIEGEDVELDRAILEQLGDPLMHIVRNSVDHGIESPDVREQTGKPREGTVKLSARRTRDRVTITVEDDGGGINPNKVRRKAIEEGILPEDKAHQFDDDKILDLIFHPGFSTTDNVSETSGRGVGLDVVYTTVRSLDGSVDVTSKSGEGTQIKMRLPVSLAIDEVLLIEAGSEEFGVPIKNISEITTIHNLEEVNGQLSHVHEGDVYPVIGLDNALNTPEKSTGGRLVRIDKGVRQIAIQCDNVIESSEVVVEPYDGVLRTIPGLSGAAVLGEGDVVNILDVERL